MSRQIDSAATGFLLLGGLGLLAFALAPAGQENMSGEPPSEGLSDRDLDVLALARMLASETEDARARVILGWITINAARTWRLSVFRLLTGKSGQFGPQKFFFPDGRKEIRYASTAKRPTAESLRIARGLLEGTLQPPALIERTKPSAYVELSKASKQLGPDGKPLQPETNAKRILSLQQRYGGIVGRVNNWFLYAQGEPPLTSVEKATVI